VKIEYLFIPPIISALYILPLVDIYLLSHIKSPLLYGGKLPPVAGKRGKNTVAGLRDNLQEPAQLFSYDPNIQVPSSHCTRVFIVANLPNHYMEDEAILTIVRSSALIMLTLWSVINAIPLQ